MLVDRLDIEEFRGIKRCEAPIKFSPFTVLIGRNNSAKSTILEVLSLLPHPTDVYLDGIKKIDLIKQLHHYKNEYFKALLYLYAGTSTLSYRLMRNRSRNKPTSLKIKIYENNFEVLLNNEKTNRNQLWSQLWPQFSKEEYENLVFFLPDDTEIIHKLEAKIEILKEIITKKGYHIDIAKRINECIDDNYSEIVLLKPVSIRKVLPDKSIYIKLSDLGSGVEKAVKFMLLIEAMNPKLVLIDDFETGFHPSLTKVFLKWLKDKKCQTVISTHSIDVLSSIVEVNIDARIIQLYKDNEDILHHKKLNFEDLRDLFNSNLDPRLLTDTLRL